MAATGIKFPDKLKGRTAVLFATICEDWLHGDPGSVEPHTTEHTPLFSWLSPHQRLGLVNDLLIGLLCSNEPFPPKTLEHAATYCALFEVLKDQVTAEMDHPLYSEDFNELYACADCSPPIRTLVSCLSEEEQRKHHLNLELVAAAAERYKARLDRKRDEKGGNAAFFVEGKSAETIDSDNNAASKLLFEGGPCTTRDPPRPLSSEEKEFNFRWRLECDAIFQEDSILALGTTELLPMCLTNFCWNSYDERKWHHAIGYFFFWRLQCHVSATEHCLIMGAINDAAYADRSQHTRIHVVRTKVLELRKAYEDAWDANQVSADLRLLWAITATSWEDCDGEGFYQAFHDKCEASGFSLETKGKYQERLDIYRSIQDNYAADENRHTFYGLRHPRQFKSDDDLFSARCSNPPCWTIKFDDGDEDKKRFTNSESGEKVLMNCTRCRVAQYCSKFCQKQHWHSAHKTECKALAAFRKDKGRLKEAIKGL